MFFSPKKCIKFNFIISLNVNILASLSLFLPFFANSNFSQKFNLFLYVHMPWQKLVHQQLEKVSPDEIKSLGGPRCLDIVSNVWEIGIWPDSGQWKWEFLGNEIPLFLGRNLKSQFFLFLRKWIMKLKYVIVTSSHSAEPEQGRLTQ